MNEVEDAVLPGIEARDERRPRDRALRRGRRRERGEAAGLRQSLEMWHPAAGHEIAHELIVQAVHAEYDDAATGLHVPRHRSEASTDRATTTRDDPVRNSAS